MYDTSGKIAIAQLAFFLLAILPAQYVLFKHGIRGLLGWLFITLFCGIRIVGAALIIHDESGNKPISEGALIVSSVAVAPMIIALGAIIHESCGSIEAYRPFIFGWMPDVINHFITVGAIVMLVLGFINLEGTGKSASDMKTGLDLIRAGGVVLIFVWAMIAAILLVSFMYSRKLRGEKQLAIGASIALVCLILRILYTVLSSFINTPSFNVRTGGTVAVKVVLDVLTEFILIISLLAAGIASRNLKHETYTASNSKGRRQDVEDSRLYRK